MKKVINSFLGSANVHPMQSKRDGENNFGGEGRKAYRGDSG
jgi:hypothetical protein